MLLCLTQTTYEGAFSYPEEMKALRMFTSLVEYSAIVCKLVSVGDPRCKVALEELKGCGFIACLGRQRFDLRIPRFPTRTLCLSSPQFNYIVIHVKDRPSRSMSGSVQY